MLNLWFSLALMNYQTDINIFMLPDDSGYYN